MIEELIKELLVPLIVTIGGASFTGTAVVAWWGIRRMVSGQDKINETLTCIREDLSAAVHRVGQLEAREEVREEVSRERHEENKDAIRDLRFDVKQLKAQRG